MSGFEYVVAMWGIVTGLAVADLIASANRLIRHPDGVTWDGRVIVAAGLVALELLRLWFAQWTLSDSSTALTFPIFLAKFLGLALLAFLASAALPNETTGRIDLPAFYERNRRYFWGLFVAWQSLYVALWLLYFSSSVDGQKPAALFDWFRVLAPLGLFIALATLRSRWLDWVGPLTLIVFYLWLYSNQAIS
jgi:hypothetical protein